MSICCVTKPMVAKRKNTTAAPTRRELAGTADQKPIAPRFAEKIFCNQEMAVLRYQHYIISVPHKSCR
jgi:hypothetical protein